MPKMARATSLRPAPTSPASATISPGPHRERDVGEHALAGQPVDLEHHLARASASASGEPLRQLPADHRPDQVVRGQPGELAVEHVAAVAHHRDPLADLEDLLQPVRDEQHRRALRRAAPATTSNSRPTSAADSAAVGSSITITRASSDSALAISTTCWSAMDSPRAIRAGSSGTPSRANIAAASVRIAWRSIRRPDRSGWRP